MITTVLEHIKEYLTEHYQALHKWVHRHIYGVLGTIIVHLLLAIFFILFKISTLQEPKNQPVLITFEQEPPPTEQLKQEKKKEKIVADEELKKWIHDIPVNEALKKQKEFDINKYIDQVKEEMIRQGQLSQNNYIDEQKKEQAEAAQELSKKLPVKEKTHPGDSLTKSEIMASHYAGPTRVKYNLPGRIARHLIIPIYECEGSGIVVVRISVNRDGNVLEASIDQEHSATNTCMHETALRSARSSRFDINLNAPYKQEGTITYYFVAQGE